MRIRTKACTFRLIKVQCSYQKLTPYYVPNIFAEVVDSVEPGDDKELHHGQQECRPQGRVPVKQLKYIHPAIQAER